MVTGLDLVAEQIRSPTAWRRLPAAAVTPRRAMECRLYARTRAQLYRRPG
jgi:biotin carboxylase